MEDGDGPSRGYERAKEKERQLMVASLKMMHGRTRPMGSLAMFITAILAGLIMMMVPACRTPEGRIEQRLEAESAASAHDAENAPSLEWIELLTGGASEDEPLPLILGIHGLGDRPEDFATLFRGFGAKARIIIPRAPIPYSGGFGWTLFRASGENREALAAELMEHARSLEGLLDSYTATASKKETIGEPIAFGFSQGAMLTYLLAIQPSPKIGAAIPIAGFLVDESLLPARAPARAPIIHAFHGDADPLIPFSLGEQAVERLKERGYRISLHRGEGVPHRIPGAYRAAVFRALEGEIERTTREVDSKTSSKESAD